MIGGGGGAAAWAAWLLYLAILAFIKLVLTMLKIHTCRGNIFNTKQGRRSALLLVAFTARDTAGVLTVAVTLVNTYLSPHVRYLRWFEGILTAARRNSQATGSRVTNARRQRTSHRFGDIGIWGFLDTCFTAYLGSVVSAYGPYAHLMVFLGFAVIATVGDVPKVIDGLNLQKTNKVLAYLGPGYMNYRANVSSTIVMYAHFVMGDYQTSFFVLLIINVRLFCFLVT
jgi:hypothetical protein